MVFRRQKKGLLQSITGAGPRTEAEFKAIVYDARLAETEGFEPSIELYNPITV